MDSGQRSVAAHISSCDQENGIGDPGTYTFRSDEWRHEWRFRDSSMRSYPLQQKRVSTFPGSLWRRFLERNAGAQLNLPSGIHSVGNRPEARCIYKSIWRIQIHLIQAVVDLASRLELNLLSN